MTTDKQHEVREHLTLILTEVYLLMNAKNDAERAERYKLVKTSIDAILNAIDEHKPAQSPPPDILIQ